MSETQGASGAEEMLRAGNVRVRSRFPADAGLIFELESDESSAGRLFVAERDDGMHLGLRLELAEQAPLHGRSSRCEPVMQALGELTYALGREGISAQFSSGRKGVDAIMLAAHLCRSTSPERLRERIGAMRSAGARIRAALGCGSTGPARSLLESVRVPPTAASTPSGGEIPYIAATFDEAARSRMLQRSELLRRHQGRPVSAADEPAPAPVGHEPERAFPDALLESERFKAC